MPINIPRGTSDGVIDSISAALKAYEADHPQAQIDVYRQNSVSVRVRIVDPDFQGQSRPHRSDKVWEYLDTVPDEPVADISTVLLLTPDETATSFAYMEFDHPAPSDL